MLKDIDMFDKMRNLMGAIYHCSLAGMTVEEMNEYTGLSLDNSDYEFYVDVVEADLRLISHVNKILYPEED